MWLSFCWDEKWLIRKCNLRENSYGLYNNVSTDWLPISFCHFCVSFYQEVETDSHPFGSLTHLDDYVTEVSDIIQVVLALALKSAEASAFALLHLNCHITKRCRSFYYRHRWSWRTLKAEASCRWRDTKWRKTEVSLSTVRAKTWRKWEASDLPAKPVQHEWLDLILREKSTQRIVRNGKL